MCSDNKNIGGTLNWWAQSANGINWVWIGNGNAAWKRLKVVKEGKQVEP